jgi:hypothetical protein
MQSVDASSSMSERFVGDGRLRLSGRNDPSLSRLCHGQTASCQPASSLSSAREGVPLAERSAEHTAGDHRRFDRPAARSSYDTELERETSGEAHPTKPAPVIWISRAAEPLVCRTHKGTMTGRT